MSSHILVVADGVGGEVQSIEAAEGDRGRECQAAFVADPIASELECLELLQRALQYRAAQEHLAAALHRSPTAGAALLAENRLKRHT